MNEDEQIIWGQPVSFLDFVLGFLAAPNQRRVELVPKADPLKFYTREKVAPPSQDLGEIRDANKERVNRSLSNYASNNFLLSTSNIRPDLNGRYNPGLGLFAGDLTALTLSMGFDPFNTSNYYKVATLIPKFRNWGLTRLLANELNNEVRVAGELGRNVGNVPTNTNNLFRATVYKGGKITDPYSTFFTTDPKYASNYGKVTPYTFESKNIVKTTEPLMGYSDPVNMDMFVYNNTRSNPKATAIIGNDKVTGEFIPSLGMEILSLTPRNFTLKSVLEPKTSLRFFERPLSRISEAERVGIPRGERNLKNPSYTLKDARKEAQEFAEKWGYDLPKNASLKDIEDLYNRHNTFFRGTTTEYFDVEKDRIAKELGLKTLTPELFLQYSATHSHPGTDRIWVTPFDHYSGFYGTVGEGFQGLGQVSAVMRPWKTPKLKDWKEKASWELGFKEDINNPVITPWVERSPGATIDRGPLTELLIKGPLIYRGLAKDFKGTLLNKLNYSRIKDLREPYLPQPPQEIIVNFKSGGKIIERFKNRSRL